jgi:CHASE2 domain-containing sensor protein
LQLATGSITTSVSLAPLWSVTDHPFLVSYVQKADVFWLWQYAVIGVSIAAFTNNSRRMGVVIAVVAILVHSLFSASLAYMGYLQAVSMVK